MTETDGSPIGKIGYPSPKGIYEGIGKSSPIGAIRECPSLSAVHKGYTTPVNAVGASPNPKRRTGTSHY